MTARCNQLGVPASGSADAIRAWVAPLGYYGARLADAIGVARPGNRWSRTRLEGRAARAGRWR